jgi:hypothetical protein
MAHPTRKNDLNVQGAIYGNVEYATERPGIQFRISALKHPTRKWPKTCRVAAPDGPPYTEKRFKRAGCDLWECEMCPRGVWKPVSDFRLEAPYTKMAKNVQGGGFRWPTLHGKTIYTCKVRFMGMWNMPQKGLEYSFGFPYRSTLHENGRKRAGWRLQIAHPTRKNDWPSHWQ